MATAKEERKAIDKILILLGSVTMVVMFMFGCIAWYGYDFVTNMVKTELAAQKIYFPPAGSAALDPKDYPGLQQYAGQLVDDGPKAKAYANEYIGKHLEEIAGGKTYSEISTEARKDPDNAKLQGQKASLFQGETLRGLLLGNGYAYWTMGMLAKYAAIAFFAGAAAMAILVVLGLGHLKRSR
jgi:hypothetical protein